MKNSAGTLLLARADVASLLTLDDCIAVVEHAFRLYGQGRTSNPKVLGMHATEGSFHIKAALSGSPASYFAAKLNANFFHNSERFDMPNIRGLILLCDASNGRPLAVMDSIEITILRTGAATAIAARHLARPDSRVATICGCGNQGRVQLRSLCKALPLERVYAFDLNQTVAREFAAELSQELRIEIHVVEELASVVRKSDVCVTCTPARRFFIHKDHVSPGTFLAGVGADNEEKQELDPQLFISSKVVVDVLDQCVEIGDLHHAIAEGLLERNAVHAELCEVVAGKKPGRTSPEEITIFDSTGTALQDVAAAALVYERAAQQDRYHRFRF